jgi:hypothetical protein
VEEEAGSQQHLVSQPLESHWTFGYESRQLWVWFLEMVLRCCRGVGDIHMNRGSLVGEERRDKETDGCPITGAYTDTYKAKDSPIPPQIPWRSTPY